MTMDQAAQTSGGTILAEIMLADEGWQARLLAIATGGETNASPPGDPALVLWSLCATLLHEIWQDCGEVGRFYGFLVKGPRMDLSDCQYFSLCRDKRDVFIRNLNELRRMFPDFAELPETQTYFQFYAYADRGSEPRQISRKAILDAVGKLEADFGYALERLQSACWMENLLSKRPKQKFSL